MKPQEWIKCVREAAEQLENLEFLQEGTTHLAAALEEIDRPTREQVESQIAGWNPPYSAPAEPAPGSDAEHPPLGYRLAKVAEKREPGYVFWDGEGWIEGGSALFSSPVDRWHSSPCANPITANEGDSQKAGLSDKIAESVVQDLQQACYDRAELRATVERLTAENASLEVENRTLRGLVRRMKEVLL